MVLNGKSVADFRSKQYPICERRCMDLDAKKLGSFIAEQRKEMNMTQANLAEKLHVTDKAISKWERGLGLPDINTIEPLADALDVSVLEIIKSEKIIEPTIANEDASAILLDTFDLVKQQRRIERRNTILIFAIVAGIFMVLFLLDTMSLLGFLGVYMPIMAAAAGLILLGYGIWRKKNKLPCLQTFVMAIILLLIPVALLLFFIIAGALGLGPIPN